MSLLREAVDAAGGVEKAAALCGVSPRAVYKWLKAGSLPRTDYTGETRYAALLAGASEGRVAANVLLAETSPGRAA
ncbi:MAG: hypothetical protein E7H60_19325 [Pseudomonas oryzihabitans]|uniref:carph-isopro domain-containing protein n=1 Tax=Pseudomonas TaxID=286 RepID=UPI000D34DFE3|nr:MULTISPECIES: hypothetical protein [Pseudomonas]MDU4058695.1 hypothetical protein [Pseudomonas oryzihabitans]QEU03078.1 helix-turn-helix domain-containing protein [Pseudomonas oryzihabitans]RAU39222.1 hypothetical protein DBY63_012130 [Pseudomonas sp. RIT 411]BDD46418.1 hypothetical protein 3 [Moraxellaceae bacterium]